MTFSVLIKIEVWKTVQYESEIQKKGLSWLCIVHTPCCHEYKVFEALRMKNRGEKI